MAEIGEKTWEELGKIEKGLWLKKLLEKLQGIVNAQESANAEEQGKELEKCFRVLQKEFLVDCLKQPPYTKDTDDERDAKKIKLDIRTAFGLEGSGSARVRNALVFGTGISMGKPFFAPNWPKLLQRIHKSYFIERYGIPT